MTKSTFLLILLEPQLIVSTEFYVDITFDQLLCCYDVRLITFNTESVMHGIVVYNCFFKFHEICDERDLYIFRDKCRNVQNIFKSNNNLTRYLKLRHDGIRWGSLQGEPDTWRKQYLLFFMTKNFAMWLKRRCAFAWNVEALTRHRNTFFATRIRHHLWNGWHIEWTQKTKVVKNRKNSFLVCEIQIIFLQDRTMKIKI